MNKLGEPLRGPTQKSNIKSNESNEIAFLGGSTVISLSIGVLGFYIGSSRVRRQARGDLR